MSDETTTRAPQQEQTYVVQMQRRALREVDEVDGQVVGEPVTAWVDLATVTVPPRTKRSVVIKKALGIAGIMPLEGKPPTCRALDVDSFEMHTPLPRQPAPEWVL